MVFDLASSSSRFLSVIDFDLGCANYLLELLYGFKLLALGISEPINKLGLLTYKLNDLFADLLDAALVETDPRLVVLTTHAPLQGLNLLDFLPKATLALMHAHFTRQFTFVLLTL